MKIPATIVDSITYLNVSFTFSILKEKIYCDFPIVAT